MADSLRGDKSSGPEFGQGPRVWIRPRAEVGPRDEISGGIEVGGRLRQKEAGLEARFYKPG